MRFFLFIAAFVLIAQTGAAQDSIHVNRQYENERPATSINSFFAAIPAVGVTFDEGFDDSVRVTVNDTIIFEGYLKTNYSIDLAGSVEVNYNNRDQIKWLKVLFIKSNRYILEKLDLSYTFLYIRGLKPWLLIYSNHIYMRE